MRASGAQTLGFFVMAVAASGKHGPQRTLSSLLALVRAGFSPSKAGLSVAASVAALVWAFGAIEALRRCVARVPFRVSFTWRQ